MPASEVKLQIPAPNIQMMQVTIKGTSPIIFNQFPKKAIQMIEEKQGKSTAAMKKKEARDPKGDFAGSFYKDKDGYVAMPALNIKQAVVSAARNIQGVTMTLLRGALFVAGDEGGLIPVHSHGKPVPVPTADDVEMVPNEDQVATGVIGHAGACEMRRDMVRLAGIGSPADVRYRGQLTDWSMTFMVKFNGDVLEPAWILNLLQIAGFSSGLGEWRPEKSGSSGTFEISND